MKRKESDQNGRHAQKHDERVAPKKQLNDREYARHGERNDNWNAGFPEVERSDYACQLRALYLGADA